MGTKSVLKLLIAFVIMTPSLSYALTCNYSLLSPRAKYEALLKKVQYRQINKQRIPYLDINPRARRTVVLAPGFSKSMLTWADQIERLSSQGYRVISMENFNIGLNLKKNDLVRIQANFGIAMDAQTLAELVKRLRPKGLVHIVGHSRGAAVGSEAAIRMINKGVRVSRLSLLSPYVEYIWEVSHMPGITLRWIIDNYSGLIGRGIDQGLKTSEADNVIGLSDSDRQRGYAYVLRGIQPYMGNSYKLSDSLEALAGSGVEVQVLGVLNDDELSPADRILEYDFEHVNVTVFEDSEMTHYWPLENPNLVNQVINP